jgi:lysyl-tRNA synthetase class II
MSWDKGLKNTLMVRSSLFRCIRHFLDGKGFIEVDTPTFCPAGESRATNDIFFKASGTDFRFALDKAVHLKRAMFIPDMGNIYEIRHRVRPDTVDAKHLPEFTSLEIAFRCSSFSEAIDLVESLIKHVIKDVALILGKKSTLYSETCWQVLDPYKITEIWDSVPIEKTERRQYLIRDLYKNSKIPGSLLDGDLTDTEVDILWLEDKISVISPTWVKYADLPLFVELVFPKDLEILNLFNFAFSPFGHIYGAAIGLDRLLMHILECEIGDVVIFKWDTQ